MTNGNLGLIEGFLKEVSIMKQKLGILLSSFVIMSYLGISPVLADIASAFPAVSVTRVQMLITLPSLMTLVLSLVAGHLTRYIYKRHLILFALGCYLVGGLLPLGYHGSVGFLLLCSGILGVGCGILVPITAAIICDYYEGNERNQMMGLQGAAVSVGGMVFTLAGGAVASILGWQKVYLIFLLFLPCSLAIFFLLPKGRLERQETGDKQAGLLGRIWFLCGIGCLYYICQNVFNTNIAMYMGEQGIGAAQEASLATAVYNFAGIFGGLLLGRIMKICKKYAVPLAFGLTAEGMFLTFLGRGLSFVLLGGFLVGFAFAVYTAAGNCLVSEQVAASQRSMGLACLSASNNIGNTLSPIVVNAAAGLFEAGVQAKFLLVAAILVLLALVTVMRFLMPNR